MSSKKELVQTAIYCLLPPSQVSSTLRPAVGKLDHEVPLVVCTSWCLVLHCMGKQRDLQTPSNIWMHPRRLKHLCRRDQHEVKAFPKSYTS